MKLKLLGICLLAASLCLSGCAKNSEPVAAAAPAVVSLTAPTPHVKSLIDKFQLQNVDFAYIKQAVGNGTRAGAKALLIDARPNSKYLSGTIPSSINIPDTQLDKFIGQLDKIAKDKEILVFCGGWECEKSPVVAGHLKSLGFTNVKLYQAGEPEWTSKSYLEIGTPVIQAAFNKNSALLMDARPSAKFMAESIPGALYMNDEELDALAGRFPADKNTPVIAFCAGYECHKSHVVANKLLELGYRKVSVYAGGLPAWKEAQMPTTAAKKVEAATPATPKKDVFIDGIKAGVDEGTVDGEWFKALVTTDKIPANVVLVDIRNAPEYASGHMKGAVNVAAGKLSAVDLAAKLPKGKVVIFTCGTGARAMEAYIKLKDAKVDVSKTLYFDAIIKCDAKSNCAITVNEPFN